MRIVIDLQAPLAAPGNEPDSSIALIGALARSAGEHQLLVALPARLGESIGRLRAALAGLLAPDRVRVYDLPTPDRGQANPSWAALAGEQLRAAFLASLAPDLVFIPDIAYLPAAGPGVGGAPALRRYASVIGLAGAVPADARDSPRLQRHISALLGADLLLAESDEQAASWRAGLAGARIAQADWHDGPSLWEHLRAVVASRPRPEPSGGRPRLAYISPLPPEKSGIADYSAELLPELARFYDIEVIVDQAEVSDGWVRANLPLRDVAWFEQHARSFDRLLYHFGNSMMHRHMFGLLERFPGVVVLHDFFLANVLHAMHYSGYRGAAMQQALLASHGPGAVQDMARTSEHSAVWKYPCNKAVLDGADGVIVHADYPRRLAEAWYGAGAARHWRTLPLLRGLPDRQDQAALRAAARGRLGLDPDQILVCTFGMIGRTKLNNELLDAWLASPLAQDRHCQLVFVGDSGASDYGQELAMRIGRCPRRNRPRITGYVSPELYQTYLAACDIAVQLRAESRGETSAAVLDCLLHGIPTIVNAHGANAELPEQVMVKLDDRFAPEDLVAALGSLRDGHSLRASLGQAARAYIQDQHAPAKVGAQYHAAIEAFALASPQRQYRDLLRALNSIPATAHRTQAGQIEVASAISRNLPATAPRQLFVDISAMVQTDLKTGIQRVVRSVLQCLLDAPPAGYRIEPVYSTGRGAPYRYARNYMLAPLDCQLHDLEDAPADMRAGDLFLGIDLLIHMVHENGEQLQQFRDRGGEVYFVVYDLLPVLRPDVFPEGTSDYFADWLQTIGKVANGLVCISRAVADELASWMEAHPPARHDRLQIGYFHLGADIDASAPSFGMPDDAPQVLEQLRASPSLIMVGTVEPRKGQLQALDAFDLLWAQGREVNLVIVGKQGWMMDALAKRMREHPQRGKRLFWLPGASDEMLLALYQASAALLAPSEGEGFGLPLIEAAQHQLPIIARDLPVFREVAGDHAYYFKGLSARELAEALDAWLGLWHAGQAPKVDGLQWLNWQESTAQLSAAILGQRWYRAVAPPPPSLS